MGNQLIGQDRLFVETMRLAGVVDDADLQGDFRAVVLQEEVYRNTDVVKVKNIFVGDNLQELAALIVEHHPGIDHVIGADKEIIDCGALTLAEAMEATVVGYGDPLPLGNAVQQKDPNDDRYYVICSTEGEVIAVIELDDDSQVKWVEGCHAVNRLATIAIRDKAIIFKDGNGSEFASIICQDHAEAKNYALDNFGYMVLFESVEETGNG